MVWSWLDEYGYKVLTKSDSTKSKWPDESEDEETALLLERQISHSTAPEWNGLLDYMALQDIVFSDNQMSYRLRAKTVKVQS